jgi:hypothetical protein
MAGTKNEATLVTTSQLFFRLPDEKHRAKEVE